LSLNGTLADYFPELKNRIENAESITLRMMLRHRSGIPNYIDSPRFSWDELPQNYREAIELALDLPATLNIFARPCLSRWALQICITLFEKR